MWAAVWAWCETINWGDAPTWIGSVGTSGALILGMVILRSDQVRRRRSGADGFTSWYNLTTTASGTTLVVNFYNSGTRPITIASLHSWDGAIWKRALVKPAPGEFVIPPTPLRGFQSPLSATSPEAITTFDSRTRKMSSGVEPCAKAGTFRLAKFGNGSVGRPELHLRKDFAAAQVTWPKSQSWRSGNFDRVCTVRDFAILNDRHAGQTEPAKASSRRPLSVRTAASTCCAGSTPSSSTVARFTN